MQSSYTMLLEVITVMLSLPECNVALVAAMQIKNYSYEQKLQEGSAESRRLVLSLTVPIILLVDGQW